MTQVKISFFTCYTFSSEKIYKICENLSHLIIYYQHVHELYKIDVFFYLFAF